MVRFLCLSLVAKVTPFHNSFHLLFTSINFNGETPSFPYQPTGWWFRNPIPNHFGCFWNHENNGINYQLPLPQVVFTLNAGFRTNHQHPSNFHPAKRHWYTTWCKASSRTRYSPQCVKKKCFKLQEFPEVFEVRRCDLDFAKLWPQPKRIYLHLAKLYEIVIVGKYSSPMDPIKKITYLSCHQEKKTAKKKERFFITGGNERHGLRY